jgi:hypothetical protein
MTDEIFFSSQISEPRYRAFVGEAQWNRFDQLSNLNLVNHIQAFHPRQQINHFLVGVFCEIIDGYFSVDFCLTSKKRNFNEYSSHGKHHAIKVSDNLYLVNDT